MMSSTTAEATLNRGIKELEYFVNELWNSTTLVLSTFVIGTVTCLVLYYLLEREQQNHQ